MEGVKTTLHTVRRIEDSQGRLIYQYDRPRRSLAPETCYLVTSILRDVVNYTTATGLQRKAHRRQNRDYRPGQGYLFSGLHSQYCGFLLAGLRRARLGGIRRAGNIRAVWSVKS